ncbi:MAG TPA: hypothetical protein GXX30_01125 [Firmicutes bacterium]|nr:hypothetical protein [Candidatus Fermentithermobacillaceae bacterium]
MLKRVIAILVASGFILGMPGLIYAGHVTESPEEIRSIWDFIKPGAKNPGKIVATYKGGKVQSIPVLSHIKPETLAVWEEAKNLPPPGYVNGSASAIMYGDKLIIPASNEYRTILEQTIPNMPFFQSAANYLMAGLGCLAGGGLPFVGALMNDTARWAAHQMAEVSLERRKWEVAAEFVKEQIKSALEDPDTTAMFAADSAAREEFWKRTGIYNKYSKAEIEYINKIVIPAVAASLVRDDYNGLLQLWQALNGVDAEVTSVVIRTPNTMDTVASRETFNFGSVPFANRDQVMDAFNGSTGALGLLYHAATGMGSGAGAYSTASGPLLDYALVWEIPPKPRKDEPEFDFNPIGPSAVSSTESFTWTYRITK